MGTPHVCFADELPQSQQPRRKEKASSNGSNGSLNNNNHLGKKSMSELEVCSSPGSSLSVSPVPRFERNLGFFRQLSRRFGLRSQDDLLQSDDAVAAAAVAVAAVQHQQQQQQQQQQQEEDAHSSSTDSCSSGRGLAAHQSRLELMSMSCASSETSSTLDIEEQQEHLQQQQHQRQQLQLKLKQTNRASFSRLHRRSTSSLRRAFESLSLTSRSLSCSGPSPPPPPPPAAATHSAMPLKSALKSASNVELHQQQPSSRPTAVSKCGSGGSCTAATSVSGGKSGGKGKPPPQRILRQPVSYTYLKGMSGLPTQRVPRSSVCCQYARR
ncbi:ecdysone-induced protein 74EF [Drosophila subobscura]|uniref:ecdysone-induced protein 74EF n=1 Tax=Drosophila subobscura TaxID=7241 RepID=UPI00155AB46F|nr:ecdysone-induced protein 74EF [Drosophila subobscura]